jgi:hypothetical protein
MIQNNTKLLLLVLACGVWACAGVDSTDPKDRIDDSGTGDSDSDADADSDSDTDTDADTDSDTDTDTDTDTDADTDTDSDADADSDADTDTDTDSDTDTDTDADTDSDTDTDTDTIPVTCTQQNQDTVCGGGPCVDGYCCDSTCDGLCRLCSLVGKEGTCSFIPQKMDLEGECALQSPSSCGTSGGCDGIGGCELYPDQTACDDNLFCTISDVCDGLGTCTGEANACAPAEKNECCEGFCTDSGGCETRAIDCPDTCTTGTIVTDRTCSCNGTANHAGMCLAGTFSVCDGTQFDTCDTLSCNGLTYYCVNSPTDGWGWSDSPSCDDGESSTRYDACVDESGIVSCRGQFYDCGPTGNECTYYVSNGVDCDEISRGIEHDCGILRSRDPYECTPMPTVTSTPYNTQCQDKCALDGSCPQCSAEANGPTVDCKSELPVPSSGLSCCTEVCSGDTGCGVLLDDNMCTGSGGEVDQCVSGNQTLTLAGACNADTCGCENQTELVCDGEDGSADRCERRSCGGDDYFCTNQGGTWRWLMDTSPGSPVGCDDENACTEGDSCHETDGCVGAEVDCGTGGECCDVTCSESEGCLITPTVSSAPSDICDDKHQLQIVFACSEDCVEQDDVGSWIPTQQKPCSDGDMVSHCDQATCGGLDFYCTNFGSSWEWRIESGPLICDDNIACTLNEVCSGASCGGGQTCDQVACPNCLSGHLLCGSTGCLECNSNTDCALDADPCMRYLCDAGQCKLEETTCSPVNCSTSDTCSGENWYDYPDECARQCDGSGGCELVDSGCDCATPEAEDCDSIECESGFCLDGYKECGTGGCVECDADNDCDDLSDTDLCSNYVCSSGTCSVGTPANCDGQQDCSDDVCAGDTWRDFPVSCEMECDGSGGCDDSCCTDGLVETNCAGVACASTCDDGFKECSAAGCVDCNVDDDCLGSDICNTDTNTCESVETCYLPNSTSVTSCGAAATNAYPITSLPFTGEGYTLNTDSSAGTDDACQTDWGRYGSYWFSFVAPSSTVTATLSAATMGGTCVTKCEFGTYSKVEILDSTCGCHGETSHATCKGSMDSTSASDLVPGSTYYVYIRADRNNSPYGFRLTLTGS